MAKTKKVSRRFAVQAADGERSVFTITGKTDPLTEVVELLEEAGAELLSVTTAFDLAHPPRFTAIERRILTEQGTDPRRPEYDPEFSAWAAAEGLEGAANLAKV